MKNDFYNIAEKLCFIVIFSLTITSCSTKQRILNEPMDENHHAFFSNNYSNEARISVSCLSHEPLCEKLSQSNVLDVDTLAFPPSYSLPLGKLNVRKLESMQLCGESGRSPQFYISIEDINTSNITIGVSILPISTEIIDKNSKFILHISVPDEKSPRRKSGNFTCSAEDNGIFSQFFHGYLNQL